MKRLALMVCLVVLALSVNPSQVEAFSLPDLGNLFGGGSAPATAPAITSSGSGFAGWLCQFIKLFCPSSNSTGGSSSSLPTAGGAIPSLNQPTSGSSGSKSSGGGFSLPNIGCLSADIIKKLWGNNPPPSWGGIGGIGKLPLLGGGCTSNSSNGGTNNTTGGGSSGLPACASGQPIKECAGGGDACQSYCTPEANRASCLTRGCYCTENSSVTDPDCTGFRELLKNPLVSRFIGSCKCGGGSSPTGTRLSNNQSSGGSGTTNTTATITACTGDFGPCQKFCEANIQACKSRVAACRAGASGDDCRNVFLPGYQTCCVEKSSACAGADITSLVQAICGSAAQPAAANTPPGPEASAPLSELQQYCQDKTTDNCQTVFDTCNKEENRRGAIECVSLDGWCRLEPDRYFCRDHGYFAEK